MRVNIKNLNEPLVFAVFAALAFLLLLVSYDACIISMAVFTLALGLLFRRERLRGWLPALLVSTIWIIASGDMYQGYNIFKLKLFGLTLFPLIAWPSFLALAYLYILPLVKLEPWPLRWLVLSLLWSVGIIAVEWIGYHLLGIHLDRGRAYPGWPILDIFHSPPWMQAAYFINGLVFMGLSSWLDRPRRDRKRQLNTN